VKQISTDEYMEADVALGVGVHTVDGSNHTWEVVQVTGKGQV